ncbi:MAG: hypothetical protein OHK0022_50200 [Roseiflexaceae bacterium]
MRQQDALRRWAVLAVALLVLAACAARPPAFREAGPASLRPGQPVPTPSGPVVLTLHGLVGCTNQGDRLDFDLATLERLGLISYVVDDPELKRPIAYTGVLLERVLDAACIPAEATTLYATALNDYKVTIPRSVVRWPVMIATLREGKRMPVADKGPLEIVFPTRAAVFDPVVYNPMWVWQLRSIEVS